MKIKKKNFIVISISETKVYLFEIIQNITFLIFRINSLIKIYVKIVQLS